MSSAPVSQDPRSRVQPALLLRQLDELWAGFGKGGDEAAAGVVRACSLTWITVVEGDDAAIRDVDAMLADVMRVHPSRAIVVWLREGDHRSLKGSVSAQCWRPFGSKQQVCIERILLESTRAGACDLPAVIRALLVADLPVVLFCRNADLLQLEGIRETSQMADRVVVDMAYREVSCASLWPRLPGLGRFVSDLAWDRVIAFRRAIAAHFALPVHRPFLNSFTRLEVVTRPHRPAPEAAYLLSWILNSLGFQREGTRWHKEGHRLQAGFTSSGNTQDPLSRVLFCGPNLSLSFVVGGTDTPIGTQRLVPVSPPPGDVELLSDEMVVEYRRRTFEQFLPETIRLFEEPPYFA